MVWRDGYIKQGKGADSDASGSYFWGTLFCGTETGRRKGKSVSHPEWVLNLTDQAHEMGIPVFMKEDLIPIMSEEQMVQELPTAFNKS